MRLAHRCLRYVSAPVLAGGLFVSATPGPSARAADPVPAPAPAELNADGVPVEKDVPTYDLIDAAKKGLISLSAEGSGDGRMNVNIKNRTKKPLRVVMPP